MLMKKSVKIPALFMAVAVMMTAFNFNVAAYYTEYGYFYAVQDGEATVIGADETVTGDTVIPSTLGGYPVTAIGDYAFEYNYEITSLVIPEGVETIGEYCFCNCDWLEEIWFPSTLEFVGNRAFDDDCFIRKLHIPDIASYVKIEYESLFSNPFWYDDEDGFEWWEDEYEKALYIGDSTVPVTDIAIPEGVEKISAYAFYGNTFIESAELPDTLTEIGERAFYKCKNLESVSFGDSLEHINEGAFEACESLGNFTLPDSLLTIGEWAFSNNKTMTEVTIPEKVKEIPLGAFSYCEALAEVNIGSGVETIGQQAFATIAATEFIIPDNVKSVGNHLFYNSQKLETVVIGDGLTTAGDWMFNECYNLKNVTLGDGITEISDKFFKIYEHVDDTKDKWIKLEMLDTGDGITALPAKVLDKDTLKEIVIGDGITSIADNQFAYFTRLERVVLGDNITSIGNNAFYRCTKLSELKMPEKIETIGSNAFAYGPILSEIVIPENVVSVGDNAFSGCSVAETVTFEGTAVKTLGSYAFSGCSALTSITIPDGVTHIGSGMFYQCEALREINLPGSLISIKSGLIRYTPYDEDYDYDEDMLYIGNYLIEAGYYDMPAKYIIRNGTKSIAQYAFSNQHTLETVVIHKGLVSMEDDIFNDCPNLTKIGFTGTQAEWNGILKGNNDFSGYDIEFNYYVCPHENTENKASVAPGCINYGYTEGVYCNDCDKWISGHRQLAISHKDNNADAICDDCSAIASDIVINEYITVGSGEFEDDLIFVAPANGQYTIRSYCEGFIDPRVSLYDSEYSFIDSHDDIDYENYDFSLTCVLEKGKTYHWIIDTLCEGEFLVLLTFDCEHTGGAATCVKKAECTNCGMEYGNIDTEAHKWDNGKVTTTATCKVEGVKTYTCQHNSGHTYTEDLGLNSSNHTNTKNIAEVKATCSTKGSTAGVYCNDCQKYISGHTEVAKNPSNHVNTKNVPEAPATFDKVGYTAGVYCNDCKKYISGHTEIPKTVPEFTDSKDAKESGNNIISNNGLTVSQLLSQAGKGAVITTAQGTAVTDEDLIGTGMVLTLADGTKKEIVVPGDADGDGKISASDARLALRASVGLESYKEDSCYYKAANVESNDKMSASDARLILRASVGLEKLDAFRKD